MKRSAERILLILNPSSGFISKDIAVALILKKLRRHFASVSLVNTRTPLQASEITRQGLKHFDVFVAFGGDGTVNSVAKAMLGSNKTLGILPGGSGNGLARNLGIPLYWMRALDTLVSGQDVSIDAGSINDRFFFNVAGMGLDGLISKKFNLESRTRGILPYVYFALKGLLEMPQFSVRVTTESSEFEEDIMILALANFRQYGAKAVIAPHASPYDRLLDLCILKKFKLLQSSLNVQRLFNGTIHKYPFYKTFKFERVHIRSLNGPIPYHFDGEYGGSELEDYEVRVIPAAVRVRIPAFKE
ncbi:MAG: diacylglycerol kinase family lipid kinase [Acidobacteria bacterium]|jgi:YegS/Rv2252/BmrU family lipid kinase|nr:diacylglycerol kinase family lipid kinase [Acidobacteriota bacterium]